MKLLSLVFGILLPVLVCAQSMEAIPGWKLLQDNGHYIFTPGSDFTYEIMPLESSSQDLDSWLMQATSRSLANYTVNEGKASTLQSFNIYSASVTDKANKKWMMHLVAYKKPDGDIRSATMTVPAGVKTPHMNTAINHFIRLSKKEGIVLKAEKKTTTTKTTTPVTAPGQGLKPSQIKGVVIHNETGIGVGGMVIQEYNAYLMLTDGTVYKHPIVSPYDLDVAKSKTEEPNKWGTWKQVGTAMVVNFPNKGESRWEKFWHWTQMPKPSEKMTGAFSTISGGGNTAMGGTSMIVSAANVNFNDKGQFTMKKVAGGSNSDFDVNTSAYSKSNAAGTYVLNGYSIEMRYNNGEKVRKLFFFYPDSKRHFGIGGSVYVPDEKN